LVVSIGQLASWRWSLLVYGTQHPLPLPTTLCPPPARAQYCHANLRIAHRDIKLGNVLLNTKYQIPILKLCDFGYSKNMMWGSVPKTRVGTAAYISPEVRCVVGWAVQAALCGGVTPS
jgi:serine/threonine protein kinase